MSGDDLLKYFNQFDNILFKGTSLSKLSKKELVKAEKLLAKRVLKQRKEYNRKQQLGWSNTVLKMRMNEDSLYSTYSRKPLAFYTQYNQNLVEADTVPYTELFLDLSNMPKHFDTLRSHLKNS